MTKQTIASLTLLLSTIGYSNLHANELARSDYSVLGMRSDDAKRFYDAIETAVGKDDAKAVSSMVRYPLIVVRENGRKVMIYKKSNFESDYFNIFNAQMKRAIKCQDFGGLLVSSRGAGFANGALWTDVSSDQSTLEITTVNQQAAGAFKCESTPTSGSP